MTGRTNEKRLIDMKSMLFRNMDHNKKDKLKAIPMEYDNT